MVCRAAWLTSGLLLAGTWGMIAGDGPAWAATPGLAGTASAAGSAGGSAAPVTPASPPAASPGPAQTPAQPPAVPPRIPTDAFAAQAFIRGPVLAPDGLHYAARSTVAGKAMVVIVDLTGKEKPWPVGFPSDFDLVWYGWAGNGTLLVSGGKSVPWEDDEAYMTRLVAVDLATKATHFVGGKSEGLDGDNVIWIDPEGKRILLSYQATIYDYPSVFSVDIASNKSTLVVPQRTDIWNWSADNDGVVRYGWGYSDVHHWQAVYRKSASDSFKVIARGRDDREDGANFDVIRIVQGSDEGYIFDTDEKTGLKAVYKFNFATRKRGDLVFEAPGSDIDAAYSTEDGKALYSVEYTDDRPRVQWWDPVMKSFQDDLDKAINGGGAGDRTAVVLSQSRDKTMKIVWVGAANDPGSYYVYQEATGVMKRIASVSDALSHANLAKPRYLHYTARDGLRIPAYLTLPLGREAKRLPLVIMPHGGPFWVRDEGGYDDDVQFLANRGYAVLQPEFRGSGSYGTAYHDKGKGQWGRAMQDDIDDGMDWLVKQGIADPKRVCLVGISYGGYAALWGATRNPERYRCAASLAGVTDIGRQVKYSNHFDDNKRSRDDWQQMVQGDKAFDLRTVSPLYTVDRLKVPVLVLHGDKDQRVPLKQSRLYADALKAAGKTFEYVTLPGDGHGYTTPAAAKTWYDRLDAFLAKYNPVE